MNTTLAKGRRLTQSRSVASFKPFPIDRRTQDNLSRTIKGAALWDEIKDEEGYWVYNLLSGNYLAIKYKESTKQWYFVQQDSQTGNWVATQPVPSTFNLKRRAIRKTSVTAVPAEDIEKKKGQHTVPTTNADSALGQPKSSAMATQTTSTVFALTLARMNTGKVASFLGQGLNTGSGIPPSGSGLSGGGPPSGPLGAGGSGGGMPGRGPPGGPNVKDWVKQWTNWIINEINTRRAPADKHFWNKIAQAFQQAFQDTGAREQAEDKLCHLVFTPGEVDTFIAQFESLSTKATYPINMQSTLLLFASKLPYCMMDHIYKVIHPIDFQGWSDDNTAVRNIRGIYEDMPKKKNSKMTPHQLARMLGVPMPSQNPNAMDTQVDRSHSGWNQNKTKGRTSATTPISEQCKTGHCFTCNQKGHLARNCPDKKDKQPQTKAHTA
ncbi:hypothetical protein EDB84DRAFT_1443048 [Lactarius hengduanensis]|nr:hypothetical protein EDB84DRAFT_1443048 [Lactarius hengduanensis]